MKWYNQILETLRSWLSLDADATEAEIHAAMEKQSNPAVPVNPEDVQNLSAIEARMDALEQGIQNLQQQVATLVSNMDTLSQQLTAANARLAIVEKTPADKTTGADTLPAAVEANQEKPGNFGINLSAGKKMPGLK